MEWPGIPDEYQLCLTTDGRRADFSYRGWTHLPDWLATLTTLVELDLSGNQLAELPDSIGTLTALTNLNLADNQLAGLPASAANLTALAKLDLSGNQLVDLPVPVKDMGHLSQLYARKAVLSRLPDWIGNLAGLSIVDLSGNLLEEVPATIGDLSGLTELNLSGNRLTSIPPQFAGLLRDSLLLRLEGNPLSEPLAELAARGTVELAAYLGSLADAERQYEAKLLLVGEGNVGKTSLVAALRGDQFISGRPTTHGIEISPIAFRHPSVDTEMTLRAWDFGGQEVYRVSHQFFFSQRGLYLMVWHARQGMEQDEVEGWLRRIQLRVGSNATVLVVATHCREQSPELDYAQLELLFPGMLAGFYEVDNSTGEGIDRLREAIAVQAAQLPQMGQLVSPRWISARREILSDPEASPQITYEQFAAICRAHDVTGPETDTLAKLMHDLGYVIYFAEDEGLRDVVVLNPEWLTKAISYVLEDIPTRRADGILDHARLKEIWQLHPGGYAPHYHPYFLRLMEKFDISYRLDEGEPRSLIPQLVPHQRPLLPWQGGTPARPSVRTLALSCLLSEPAPGLISWLTVRHHRASTGMHWRRGVFLRHPIAAYASEALIELRGDRELTLQVRAPSPDLYFNVLRDGIEDLITRRWPGLDYRLLIPCPAMTATRPSCSGQFPLDGLLRVREGGRATTIPCMDCGEIHEISALLTGFTVPAWQVSAEVGMLHDHLTDIRTNITEVQKQTTEIAQTVRRVQLIVGTEVTDCPRLFTLARNRDGMLRRVRILQYHYRLTLWCEHPGYWHPWEPASYDLDPPREWLVRIAPYASLVFRTLQLVMPLAGAIGAAALPQMQGGSAQTYIQLMNTIVAELPDARPQGTIDPGVDTSGSAGKLTASEGAALRAVRAIIFQHDQLRSFGGMRRVQAPSGELLWVCADHYPYYDPGLPFIP